ncbi:unnamed protein product [Orchesella dallaii]|uniref:Gustatory receptor n=1 Tax=Orchesella dallaii TaxID=48710 RepID=A0ABP1S5D3_9HEXA
MTPLESVFQRDFESIIRYTKSNKFSKKVDFSGLVQTQHYQIANVFYPLVLLLKGIGCCPLTVIRRSSNIRFEFKWLSIQVLIQFFLAGFAGFVLITWINNALLDLDYPLRLFRKAGTTNRWINDNDLKGSELIMVVNNCIRLLLPLGSWIMSLVHWIGNDYFCQFLNDWSQFAAKFEEAFKPNYKLQMNLTQMRNLFCIVWITPAFILLFTINPVNLMAEQIPTIISFGISYFFTIFIVAVRSICYVKDYLILQTLQMAYEQVLNGMRAQYGKYKTSISKDQVHSWMELLTFIRMQNSRVESYIESNFLQYIIIISTFFLFSLFWKTYLAESITSMEQIIAEEVIEMDVSDGDCETRLEMKLICDMIYNDPIKIRLGNMIVLNRSLLLAKAMTSLESFQEEFGRIISRGNSAKMPMPKQLPSNNVTEFETPKDYRIARILYPLILLVRWVGCCPLKIIRKGPKVIYNFKRISFPVLGTICFLSFMGFIMFVWMLNGFFGIHWPMKLFGPAESDGWVSKSLQASRLILIVNYMIKVLLPAGPWIGCIVHGFNLESLCKFLNNWTDFIHKFEIIFSSDYELKIGLTRTRNWFFASCLIPILAIMTTFNPLVYIAEDISLYIAIPVGYFILVGIIVIRSVMYLKDYLLLLTVQMAYREVFNGMKAQYGKHKIYISRGHVQKWMEMLSFLRQQTSELQNYLGLQSLWSIFEMFLALLLNLSMTAFLFTNGALNGEHQGSLAFLSFAGIFTVFYVVSLYLKMCIAESITNVEEEIAEEIIGMNTSDDDCSTRLEMKLICDMIFKDPIKIRVENLLTLNKGLLFAFFSQLATYLVIILQFTK